MGKFVLFVIGLIVGFLGGAGGLIYLQAQRVQPDDQIVFADKMFYDNEVANIGYIAMSGTLTGEGLAYPNNTYAITCRADTKECYVSSIEQIGHNQIGRMDGPCSYAVVKWTAAEVVAQDEPGMLACRRTTITIDRRLKESLWLEEPINQTQPICKNAETRIRKYTVESSPGRKRVFAPTAK